MGFRMPESCPQGCEAEPQNARRARVQQEESEDRTNLARETFCKNEPVLHPSVSKLNRVRATPIPRPLPAPRG